MPMKEIINHIMPVKNLLFILCKYLFHLQQPGKFKALYISNIQSDPTLDDLENLKKFNSLIFENLLASRRCLITRKAIFRYKRTPERENILTGAFFCFCQKILSAHRQLKQKSHSLFGDLTSCVCPPIYIGSTATTWLADINSSPSFAQFWFLAWGKGKCFFSNWWCVSLLIESVEDF